MTNGKLYNFAKRTWGEIINMDIPYDLGSDMHYGAKVSSIPPPRSNASPRKLSLFEQISIAFIWAQVDRYFSLSHKVNLETN